MLRPIYRCLPAVLVLGACSGDDGESLPGRLSGTWTLPESTWLGVAEDIDDDLTRTQTTGSPLCNVNFSGTSGSAKCEFGIAGDEEWNEEIHFEADASVEFTVELRETSISVEGRWTSKARATRASDDLDDLMECTMTFNGSASRGQGRDSSGRFASLAGTWQGTATTTGRCDYTTNSEFGAREDEDLNSAWTFSADVFGEQGTAEVARAESGDLRTWILQNSAQGVLVRRLGSDDATLADEIE